MNFHRILCALLALSALCMSAGDKYYNAADLRIVNRPCVDDSGLSRLDWEKYDSLPDIIKRYSDYSTGLAVMFNTDSPYIKAKWRTGKLSTGKNITPLMQSGLDLYIKRDSVWVHAAVGIPSDSLYHESQLIDSMEDGVKECLLYLPLMNSLKELEIGVDDNAFCVPSDHRFRRRVVFVGSSITHGASASRPGMAFPAMLQRQLDVECVNLGYSGSCKLEPFYNEFMRDAQGDFYIIDPFSNPTAQQIEERLPAFINGFKEMCPDHDIYFLQTEVREEGNFNTRVQKREEAKRLAAEEGMKAILETGVKNVYFVNPGLPLGDSHELTADGTHPTDAGFILITGNLAPIIQKYIE